MDYYYVKFKEQPYKYIPAECLRTIQDYADLMDEEDKIYSSECNAEVTGPFLLYLKTIKEASRILKHDEDDQLAVYAIILAFIAEYAPEGSLLTHNKINEFTLAVSYCICGYILRKNNIESVYDKDHCLVLERDMNRVHDVLDRYVDFHFVEARDFSTIAFDDVRHDTV